MSNYLGIDPGKEGALAILDSEGEPIALYDMPSSTIKLAELFETFPKIERGCIEETFPGKEMGKPSCMTFGINVGCLWGVMAANHIFFTTVKPKVWQKVYGVTGKSRGNDSINQCLKIYPDSPLPLIEGDKRLDGRSDALLIARWLWRQEMAR